MGTASPAPNSLVCTASLVPDTLSHAVSLAMAPVTPVSPLQQGAGLRAQDEQHLVTSSLPWHLPQVVLEWRTLDGMTQKQNELGFHCLTLVLLPVLNTLLHKQANTILLFIHLG